MPSDPFTDFKQQVARGDTVVFDATITRPPGGPPVDLTGAELACTGRRDLEEAAASYVFRVETGSGISVTNAAGGQCRVTIPAAATAQLVDWPALYVDLELTEADGRVSTPLRGRLILTPDVSRVT
jgi:hypothetical protein